MLPLAKLDKFQELFYPLLPVFHIIDNRMELHVLVCCEVIIKARVLEHYPKALPDLQVLVHRVKSIDLHCAAGRMKKSREHLDSCSLSCPIRPKKSEYLSALH